MPALLDTHAILWFLHGDVRLSRRARREIEKSENLFFSPVSLWEIGIKLGLNKPGFQLAEDWWRSIPQALTSERVGRLDVRPEDFRDVAILPLHHRDPFDRMLVVQAKSRGCAIISADRQLEPYRVELIW